MRMTIYHGSRIMYVVGLVQELWYSKAKSVLGLGIV